MFHYTLQNNPYFKAKERENIFPADFTSFDIAIHVILWCATYGPPLYLKFVW